MTTHKRRILIAEDDQFIKKILDYRLQKEGFQIVTADTGNEALEKLGNNEYDMVLLDLIMPGMNGFEVLAELKKQKNKVPVLVFSNLSQKEDQHKAMMLGAKGYYVKSDMAIHEFSDIIKRHLI